MAGLRAHTHTHSAKTRAFLQKPGATSRNKTDYTKVKQRVLSRYKFPTWFFNLFGCLEH